MRVLVYKIPRIIENKIDVVSLSAKHESEEKSQPRLNASTGTFRDQRKGPRFTPK